MSRCKACDAILNKYEMEWDDETKQHDDMCYVCRGIVLDCEREEAFMMFDDDDASEIINTVSIKSD